MALRDQLNVPTRAELYGFVLAEGQAITVLGVSAAGDIPAELWRFDSASMDTDNGTTVIQPTAIPPGNPGRYLIDIVQADYNACSNTPSLATVATTGDYTDLTNTPSNGVPVGALLPYGGSSAPSNWLICDGSAVSRVTNATLFSVIGTAYGMGDGSTTFNLPDLRQRFPLGLASSGTGSSLGATGGTIDHTHGSPVTTGVPSATVQATALLGGAASTDHTHTVTIPSANPPFQTFNFIIKI
jgi:microcystin-dependent protein